MSFCLLSWLPHYWLAVWQRRCQFRTPVLLRGPRVLELLGQRMGPAVTAGSFSRMETASHGLEAAPHGRTEAAPHGHADIVMGR